MTAGSPLKNTVSMEEWIVAINETQKHCILEKTVFCH